jgi:Glycosyltransferase family 10 (fucosyltransferase) C-term
MTRMNDVLPLVRIAADYDCSRLPSQTPGKKGIWNGVRFTLDEVADCDYFVMLNNRNQASVQVRCPRAHVWCLIQEPYVPGQFDWMIENHDNFARVFAHHIPSGDPKYVRSHPALSWEIKATYDDLVAMTIPTKRRAISFIASTKTWLPGNRRRSALREFLMRTASDKVDVFGRGIRYIEDKWVAFAPYRYSVAVENSISADYWTEKIAECFLGWTIPLYDGCPNIGDYFPADSFIRIDAGDHRATLAKIDQLLRHDEWEQRLPAIREARRRVLEKYQLFPALVDVIRRHGSNDHKRSITTFPPYAGMSLKSSVRYHSYMVKQRILNR